MGLFSAFSKQRQPRGFNLQHRYYDEKKAKMESLRAERQGQPLSASENRREQLREAWASKRTTNARGSSARGPLMLILILGALAYFVLRYLAIPHIL